MSSGTQIKPFGWIVAAAAAAVIFSLDVLIPLGIATPMLYVLPILLTLIVPGYRATVILAGSTVFFTWVKLMFSDGEITHAVMANRTMGSVLQLVVAALLIRQKRLAAQRDANQAIIRESEERLRLLNESLEQRIGERTAALQEAEERFRGIFEHAAEGIVIADATGNIVLCNKAFCGLIGYAKQELISRHLSVLIHPDDRTQNLELVQEVLERKRVSFSVENRYITKSGNPIWVQKNVTLVSDDQNHPIYFVVLVTDISQRRQAETVLREREAQLRALSAKLLQVQEEERRLIARDLHDDVTQRLAALTLELHEMRQYAADTGCDPSVVSHVKDLGTSVERLTTDVQQLAHHLHPSILEHVGLEAAVREHVDEFAVRTGLATEVLARDIPKEVSLDQATCLYRVLQESLQNVRKHANASNVLIRLLGTNRGVGICVHDDGRGFEHSESSIRRPGLGLTSMAERVWSLKGTFRVRTRQDDGTEIHAWVPLEEVKGEP